MKTRSTRSGPRAGVPFAWLAVLIAAPSFQGCSSNQKPPAPGGLEVIELIGSAANGKVIDCAGGWFNGGKPTELIIRSEETAGGWDRPQGVVIRNCKIRGSIRIMGMGRNGQAKKLRESSVKDGHTERAQAAAPTDILLSNVEVEGAGRIPIYLAPGTTEVTIEKCRITGRSNSVGLYLDAESARNVLRDNVFALRAGREFIAVDGSAENRIEDNRFEDISRGGIYLYRNCGEGGTVRHQTPHGNLISGNRFDTTTLGRTSQGIWLGSRNGRRLYCGFDAGHPFGSSADDRDFADDNELAGNVFDPPSDRAIKDEGKGNVLR
jgi:parallel beta-helix repeat protein